MLDVKSCCFAFRGKKCLLAVYVESVCLLVGQLW